MDTQPSLFEEFFNDLFGIMDNVDYSGTPEEYVARVTTEYSNKNNNQSEVGKEMYEDDEEVMSAESDVKALKKVLKKFKKVKSGTVVRWKSSIYTYAAVYAGGKWWITGTGRWYGKNVFEYAEFMEILTTAEKVEMATAWTKVSS